MSLPRSPPIRAAQERGLLRDAGAGRRRRGADVDAREQVGREETRGTGGVQEARMQGTWRNGADDAGSWGDKRQRAVVAKGR